MAEPMGSDWRCGGLVRRRWSGSHEGEFCLEGDGVALLRLRCLRIREAHRVEDGRPGSVDDDFRAHDITLEGDTREQRLTAFGLR